MICEFGFTTVLVLYINTRPSRPGTCLLFPPLSLSLSLTASFPRSPSADTTYYSALIESKCFFPSSTKSPPGRKKQSPSRRLLAHRPNLCNINIRQYGAVAVVMGGKEIVGMYFYFPFFGKGEFC